MDTHYTTDHALQALRDVTEAYWDATGQDLSFTQTVRGLSTTHDDAARWLCPDGWAEYTPVDQLPGILAEWISVLIEVDQTADWDDPDRYAVSRQWLDDTVAQAVADLNRSIEYWRNRP